jgi:hypothetical protein
MQTVLIFLALLVAVGVSAGFQLGWFKCASRDAKSRPNVTFSVRKDRIVADKDTVVGDARD